MEEHVGAAWHRLITRAASHEHPDAAVGLRDMERILGVFFRALGGDGGLKVENATATDYKGRRSWLARIAGSQRRVELAWRDEHSLRLPERIALFPDTRHNRNLYLWLAALAAATESPGTDDGMDWFVASQRHTRNTLARYPGLAPRYRELVAAQLAIRLPPEALPPAEAAAERAIRQALEQPGSVDSLPEAKRPPQPVYLWLHPHPPQPQTRAGADGPDPDGQPSADGSRQLEQPRRRQGERVQAPDGRRGLIVFRLESLFSWSEFVHVDRPTEEDEEIDAQKVADDLDVISVAKGDRTVKSRLRLDLDLPAAENDDTPLGEGLPLPEWDYRKKRLVPDYCRLQEMRADQAPPCPLPQRLGPTARRLRNQFRALVPTRVWHRKQSDGCDIDLDAWLLRRVDRRRGRSNGEQNLYRDFRGGSRNLAVLLLADLSLSTDTYVNDNARVVDVVRDSLFLFAEALSATEDRFALYGFSSKRRGHVRFNVLKPFEERLDASVRGRIQAIKPGYYTRMGAAIRHASGILSKQPADQRLLILLTDGKPNDLDRYEGRYGVEDTRMSLLEARRAGLTPFCVTIDQKAQGYLPYLFGAGGFVVIRNPLELPRRLPQLYVRLSR